MALTTEEQRFYDFAKGTLPAWIPDGDEFLHGAAKMFGSVKALIDYLFGQTLISTAEGATSETPDWLNQHAADRGTRRTLNEDDPTLRDRLRKVPDALTRVSILAAINSILDAAGISDDAALVELPYHGAHSSRSGSYYTAMAGTGGAFTKTGTTMRFTPSTLPWPRPPFFAATLVPTLTTRLVLASSEDANNNGTHVITDLDGNAAMYTDADGVANAADTTVTWSVQVRDVDSNVRTGFARAFSLRGYRSARIVPLRLVVILPFGSTASHEASVREALRQKKAAGIAVTVERRLIAP
jgi:hypothetical protein